MFTRIDASDSRRGGVESWVIVGLMVVYAAMVFAAIAHHEPWFDETHAWIYVGRFSMRELFLKRLRIEGTPGLWHGLLWVLVRLHVSFTVVRYLTGVIGCCAAYLVLRFAPFSLWLRGLIPFTFFLVYQYAVIARQYVLFPLMVFLLVVTATRRRRYDYLLAAIAGLLANTSLYGLGFAVSFVFVVIALRKRLPWGGTEGLRVGPLVLLAACVALAVGTAMPLRELAATQTAAFAARTVSEGADPFVQYTDVSQGYEAPAGMNGLEAVVWQHMVRRMDAVTHRPLAWRAIHGLVVVLSIVAFPVSTSTALALVLLGSVVLKLRRQQALVLLLPYGLLVLLCLAVRVGEHHIGMLFVALVAALWMSYELGPGEDNEVARTGASRLEVWTLTVFYVVCLLQVGWGVHALINDIRRPYTGDQGLADFLRRYYGNETIAFGEFVDPKVTLLYLDRFRVWELPSGQAARVTSLGEDHGAYAAELERRPRFVVEGEYLAGDDNLTNQVTPVARVGSDELLMTSTRLIKEAGYMETHRFCGQTFMRWGYSREVCSFVYERGDEGPALKR